jgi:8-oxo-dGTP diphosphatase
LDGYLYVNKTKKAMPHTYDYPRPALTADALVHCPEKNSVLLIKRLNPPFENQWALPGGFIEEYELPLAACIRELREETGLQLNKGQLIGVFGEKGRDPRGWTVSLAYHFVVDSSGMEWISAGSDSKEVQWYVLSSLPELAFDHFDIIRSAGLF